jgi:hypothetical protein
VCAALGMVANRQCGQVVQTTDQAGARYVTRLPGYQLVVP